MAQQKLGSAGVSSREFDNSAVVPQQPSGVPAGIIGTANKGPAFVPITLGNASQFYAQFGKTDGKKFGPLAVAEWLRFATSATFLRVLGVGEGRRRNDDGTVARAGFVVGEELPSLDADGILSKNPYAADGGASGRTYFLGATMSGSDGSTMFDDIGMGDGPNYPILRGVLMAASGVALELSGSGFVLLDKNGEPRQEFTMNLLGHTGADSRYPNTLVASFDMTAPNYFGHVFNTDPYKLQEAGHYLYAKWDVHPSLAVVTGSATPAFLSPGAEAYNTGTPTVPNYENWETRFEHACSPWFISQRLGGAEKNLFRLHSLDAGAGVADQLKISIENIVVSKDPQDPYSSFDVVLREWDDRDNEQRPLESFRGVNLNPVSERYICRVIGDANVYFDFERAELSQRLAYEGSYQNVSAYVRVEVSDEVENEQLDPSSIPVGFRGPYHLATSGDALATMAGGAVTPPVPFRKNIVVGTGLKKNVNPLLYWGVQFEHTTSTVTPNSSTLRNDSIKAWTKYFPDFATDNMNVWVGDNPGVPDTPENGVLDADRFCNNKFSLENIKVVTGSMGTADPTKWFAAEYVRNGNIGIDDDAKTRRLQPSDFNNSNRRFLKFTTFMQGGFDGVNIFDRDEAELSNAAIDADMISTERGLHKGATATAYAKALSVMKNVVNTDIKLLAMPGIRNPIITDLAVNSVTERFDAMYIMDIDQYDTEYVKVTKDSQIPSVDYTILEHQARGLDTSFAAAYFPDVVIKDPNTRTNVVVPPSVVVLGALAQNDAIAHPWFAPAGFTRGALGTTLEARVRLSKPNLDALANANINPLTAFPGNASAGTSPKGGVVVWGQKTLQVAASSLDRVNVRRLLIELRRQVRDVVSNVTFEPNRDTTLSAITAAITPRFRRVQTLAGLERFKIVFDTSTTTQADILNNTVRGKIWVQPTKVIEQVFLDFEIKNNIVSVE